MPIQYLDGRRFRVALLAASERVQSVRAELNRINVFPVPDGDTGTNLALTVGTIADRMHASRAGSFATVAAEAADAGIVGARGNCGMILSHFLLGLADHAGSRTRLTVPEFADALRGAVDHLYAALDSPVEGTIVTVIRETAEEAVTAAADSDFAALLDRLVQRARNALARTPELLPALRSAGVVDAGAKGFVHLLEGAAAYVRGQPVVDRGAVDGDAVRSRSSAAARAEMTDRSEVFRFCTEALVRGASLPDAGPVRAELRELGDSLIVVRGEGVLKVHIHTDDPERVFGRLRAHGRIAARKAEDMKAQHDAIERAAEAHVSLARRPVAVVTDTGCDLPAEILRAHGIRTVPLLLVYDDETLRDRYDIDSAGFVERLRRGEHPGTSQPSPADFLDAFARAAEDGETLVGVILASALSGTLAAAETAARRFDAAPVRLVDSRGASLLQGLLALRAAELAEAGVDAAGIADRLARIRDRSGILFTVDAFDRLLASGRVTQRQAWLGSLLGIKPILELGREGRVHPAGQAWGRRRLIPKVLSLLEERIAASGGRVRFGVVHVDCEAVAERVRAAIEERFRPDEVIVAPATPVIATHIGRGAWGVAFTVEEPADHPAAEPAADRTAAPADGRALEERSGGGGARHGRREAGS